MHLLAEACSVARALAPAMVVVEDVDLIAERRGMHPGHHPMLYQLLNEMDGLAEDADMVFVLTTNRADLLEPALATRPGRVEHLLTQPAAPKGHRVRAKSRNRHPMPAIPARRPWAGVASGGGSGRERMPGRGEGGSRGWGRSLPAGTGRGAIRSRSPGRGRPGSRLLRGRAPCAPR